MYRRIICSVCKTAIPAEVGETIKCRKCGSMVTLNHRFWSENEFIIQIEADEGRVPLWQEDDNE